MSSSPSFSIAMERGSMADNVVLARPGPAARFSFRGDDAAIAALGSALGLALPREACRATEAGGRAALWLGPDEWLIVADGEEPAALFVQLTEALGTIPASLVDISERQVAIDIAGAKAAEALNAFNALDLDPAAFPVGMVTRTLFGKAEIVLWRREAERFRIEVWRSFAPYVLGCLEEARREFAPA
jgi:sarcosine oxidase subunit gamma